MSLENFSWGGRHTNGSSTVIDHWLLRLADDIARGDVRPETPKAQANLARLLTAIEAVVQGADAESAFALRLGAGRNFAREQRFARRDALFAEFDQRYFRRFGTDDAGAALAEKLAEYRAEAWPHHRAALLCPHGEETMNSFLWRLLREVDQQISGRRVADIIRRPRQLREPARE